MPNWVSNNVVVTAESKAELDAFLEKAKGEQSKVRSEGNEKFHFGGFIHPSDEELPYYKGEIEEEKPEGWDELSSAEQLAHKLKFEGRDWYDWNVRNWGTKWDACDVVVDESQLNVGVLAYHFSTAWSPAEGAYQRMVEQHPTLAFSFHCEEEQGWGVEYDSVSGELVETNSWDIPDSHADYVGRDNEDGCVCSYEDDQDEWYNDCPKEEEIVEQSV